MTYCVGLRPMFSAGDMSAHEVKQLVDSLKIHVEGSMPIAGVINAENGQKLSIYQATKAGLIRKGTAYELLEAQAACGKIVDVQTGRVLRKRLKNYYLT